MPQRPQNELRPQKFLKIGDEENAFHSYDEYTDDQGEEEERVQDDKVNREDATERTPLLVN